MHTANTPSNAPIDTSPSTPLLHRLLAPWSRLSKALDTLQPAAALAARLYVGQVFFLAGLTKLRDWGTTVALFTDEYRVPWLSPALAAFLGTAGELVLPVLLVLGLGGRLGALLLQQGAQKIHLGLAPAELRRAGPPSPHFWRCCFAGTDASR